VTEPRCPLANTGDRFPGTCCLVGPMMTVAAHSGETLPLASLDDCGCSNQTSRTHSIYDLYFYYGLGVALRGGLVVV